MRGGGKHSVPSVPERRPQVQGQPRAPRHRRIYQVHEGRIEQQAGDFEDQNPGEIDPDKHSSRPDRLSRAVWGGKTKRVGRVLGRWEIVLIRRWTQKQKAGPPRRRDHPSMKLYPRPRIDIRFDAMD